MSAVPTQTRPSGAALATGFAVLAAVTFALIVLGALVRANGAGLACPDWPLCFGEVIPTFDVKIAFEWGHRAIAGGISIGLAVLGVLAWRYRALRVKLGVAGVLLVVQALFGALTVWLLLAPWTVTVHLVLGNSFFLLLLWLAADVSELRRPVEREPLGTAERAVLAAVAACLLLQFILGGLVSSHGAGLACSSFPTCNGESIAPTLEGLVGLHVMHRLNAFALLASLVALVWVARPSRRLGRLARVALRLVALQIAVGIANVVWLIPVELTAVHSALATALVAVTGLAVREAVYARAAVARTAVEVGAR